MKAIILSIQSKWVAKILNNEKTIEVRKSCPKETHFKVYIYCTKGAELWSEPKSDDGYNVYGNKLNGKVVASFICDRVTNIHCFEDTNDTNIYSPAACLTDAKICEYLNYKNGYALHISDLKIFEPKELGGFRTICKHYDPYYMISACSDSDCPYLQIKYIGRGDNRKEMWCDCKGKKPITRPPQSWQYCEELI